MKSNPNEPESAPRRANSNRVIIAWALGGFLLVQLVMMPPKTEPAATPVPARSDAAPASSAVSETRAFERPGRERPASRDRLYRDIPISAPVSAAPVAAPGAAAKAAAVESPAAAAGAAVGAAVANALVPEPAALALEAGGYPIPGAFIDRPGRPEARPQSRDFDIRGSDPRHTLASD